MNTGAVYIGISLGPFLGGILTQNLGWRSVFLVNVPLGILALFLTVLLIHEEWADASESKFDFLGSIVYGLSLALIVFGISSVSSSFSRNTVDVKEFYTALALLALGITFMLFFVFFELKSNSPVLNIRLFHNNIVFTYCSFAALINYSATYA
ncbi:MAG: MFS transporter, partial [Nitrososphaeria archaeon]